MDKFADMVLFASIVKTKVWRQLAEGCFYRPQR